MPLILAVMALLCAIVSRAWAAPGSWPGDDVFSDGNDNLTAAPPLPMEEPGDSELTAPIVPPIPPRDLIAAAYRAAAVADDPIASWRLRSRLIGLIPSLSTRVGRDQSWRDVVDPTLGYRDGWDVRATWHFDRLVFDPTELRVSAMAIQRQRERYRIATHAIRLYYRWLVADSAAQSTGRASWRWALRKSELLAQLDAITEGWFSTALARQRAPK